MNEFISSFVPVRVTCILENATKYPLLIKKFSCFLFTSGGDATSKIARTKYPPQKILLTKRNS